LPTGSKDEAPYDVIVHNRDQIHYRETGAFCYCSGAVFTKNFILPLGVLLNRTKIFTTPFRPTLSKEK